MLAAKAHHRTTDTTPQSAPLSTPTENADDLVAVNEPDTMLNEQTWPTEEEMASAPGAMQSDAPRMKRVPKGTSAYQAAWIMDDNEDDGDEDDEDDEDMEEDEDDMVGHDDMEEAEEMEEIEMDSRQSEVHRDLDPEQEEKE
jgi:pre-rRNA-processing protein TSR1